MDIDLEHWILRVVMLSLWPREETRVLMVESDEIMRKLLGERI